MFVCLSVRLRHNSKKTNESKIFKLGIGNDLGISYEWYGFGVERSMVKVSVTVRVHSNTAWVRTLWVPSCYYGPQRVATSLSVSQSGSYLKNKTSYKVHIWARITCALFIGQKVKGQGHEITPSSDAKWFANQQLKFGKMLPNVYATGDCVTLPLWCLCYKAESVSRQRRLAAC